MTHAAQPLQRSETKIEKTPPAPGFFFSGVAKMAFVFSYAIGTFSITSKSWRLASAEKPFTSLVTFWMICGSGTGSFARPSRIISRVRFSISGMSCSIFWRSLESVT